MMASSLSNSLRPLVSGLLASGAGTTVLLDGGVSSAQRTSWLLGGVRGKKKQSSGSTKNQCGFPVGKKRGAKVYDGQRVPYGSVLVNQIHMTVFPGLNTRFGSRCSIMATHHGRVMFTVERTNLDFENDSYVQRYFSEDLKGRNMFRTTVHVIPDEQHQYFKLLDSN
ncbi:unnamed protein product [Lepeophtheirus salmonis]|uniref:(salmon louse) hypothetical protein n=2 Tax=Lepeophtheirus salmonis TaxID=72036 RepID=D3PHZ3_LEPSM|nr:uncharacterized protein LOC121120519 [Lepeophtheirus salmonis]ADD38179.1 39S ribosomal protein L27, mitochondrial [Lepeophtheirus salmonis]CAB4066850.1 unnamed protein product [Lepeophtheirus salmonis]CAF2978092.1 unnamed protein product [Lepeophtheirus salmonis]